MNLRTSCFLLLLMVSLVSCDKTRVFDDYKKVGKAWHKDSIVAFSLPEMDSTNVYNMFVNVRSNKNYEFSNLFLIVNLESAAGNIRVDTLEYMMADPDGRLLGQGFADIKESKLFYKERFRFSPAGAYRVLISQAVRRNGKISGVDKLEGITEVGFRIESIE